MKSVCSEGKVFTWTTGEFGPTVHELQQYALVLTGGRGLFL